MKDSKYRTEYEDDTRNLKEQSNQSYENWLEDRLKATTISANVLGIFCAILMVIIVALGIVMNYT